MSDRYAVFGNPLGHSRSPMIHARFAQESGQDLSYEKIEAPRSGFKAALRRFIAEGGRGCNVTAPFKIEALECATRLSPTARIAGAANTLCFDGADVFAENTDGIGLLRDIETNLHVSLRGRRVLLLGAGGAARGALIPMLMAGPEQISILNRTPAKAMALRDMVAEHGKVTVIGPHEASGHDLLINATSASLSGTCPALPDAAFEGASLAYDLCYGTAGGSPFLERAVAAGVPLVADGVGMLVEQAAAAFELWRETRPETADLIKEMRNK